MISSHTEKRYILLIFCFSSVRLEVIMVLVKETFNKNIGTLLECSS